MAELCDGGVDLIVTSPPYYVDPSDPLMEPALLRSGKADPDADHDRTGAVPQTYEALLDLLERCFAECWRVLKPGGVAAVNVASTLVKGRLYPLPWDLCVRLRAAGWYLKEEIVWRRWRGWDKRAGTLIQKPYPGYFFPNRVFEYVLLFTKPGPPIWADRSEEEKAASQVDIDRLYARETANAIWNILPVVRQHKRGHPCPFPDELVYRLVSLYSYAGETVLDPFTGSGTTAKVAHLLGRRFVGYEVNPDFVRLARERLRTEPTIRRERRVCRFETLDEDDGAPTTAKIAKAATPATNP